MDINRIINELSKNEKRVLLILKKFNGKSSPKEILEKGKFQQEVEVMNASSWLQSKKLVKLEERIKKVYSLGNEGKQFLEKGLPEKRALKLINDKNGKVTLKKNCKIGSHPVVMPGITIGENSVIGAFSFVNKDIPPNVVAFGVPAKVVRELEK